MIVRSIAQILTPEFLPCSEALLHPGGFLPGQRVRIRSIANGGRLAGSIATVTAPHDLIDGWYKIRLHEAHNTIEAEWSVPAHLLEAVAG
jgi:hypothetical protein